MSTTEDSQRPMDGNPCSKEATEGVSAPTASQGTELSGLRLAAVFTVLCLAVFLVALVSHLFLF